MQGEYALEKESETFAMKEIYFVMARAMEKERKTTAAAAA
jgi:hypothetical protein